MHACNTAERIDVPVVGPIPVTILKAIAGGKMPGVRSGALGEPAISSSPCRSVTY